jgi:hypothetical protein
LEINRKFRIMAISLLGIIASSQQGTVVDNTQNLVLYSEQLDNVGGWGVLNAAVVADQAADTLGATTLDRVTASSNYGYMQQSSIPVTASTTYFIAFDVRNGNTLDDLAVGILNQSNADASVLDTSYLSSTNTTTTVRLSYSFTTPVGCTLIKLRLTGGLATEYAYIGRVQIAETGKTYVTITNTRKT